MLDAEFDKSLNQAYSSISNFTEIKESIQSKKKSFNLLGFFSNLSLRRTSIDDKIEQINSKIDNLKKETSSELKKQIEENPKRYSPSQLKHATQIANNMEANLSSLQRKIREKKNSIDRETDQKKLKEGKNELRQMIKKVESLINHTEHRNAALELLDKKIVDLAVINLINRLEELELYSPERSKETNKEVSESTSEPSSKTISKYARKIEKIIKNKDIKSEDKIGQLTSIESKIMDAIQEAKQLTLKVEYQKIKNEYAELREKLSEELETEKDIPRAQLLDFIKQLMPGINSSLDPDPISQVDLDNLKQKLKEAKDKFEPIENIKDKALPDLRRTLNDLVKLDELSGRINDIVKKYPERNQEPIRLHLYELIEEKTGANLSDFDLSQLSWENCVAILKNQTFFSTEGLIPSAYNYNQEKMKIERSSAIENEQKSSVERLNLWLQKQHWMTEEHKEQLRDVIRQDYEDLKADNLSEIYRDQLDILNHKWENPEAVIQHQIPAIMKEQLDQRQQEEVKQFDHISNLTLKEGAVAKFTARMSEYKLDFSRDDLTLEKKEELYNKIEAEIKDLPLQEAKAMLSEFVNSLKTVILRQQELIRANYNLNPEEQKLLQEEIEKTFIQPLEAKEADIATLTLSQFDGRLEAIKALVPQKLNPGPIFDRLSEEFRVRVTKKSTPELKDQEMTTFVKLKKAKEDVLEDRKSDFFKKLENQVQERQAEILSKFEKGFKDRTEGLFFEGDPELEKLKKQASEKLKSNLKLGEFNELKEQINKTKSIEKFEQVASKFDINKLRLFPDLTKILQDHVDLIVEREKEIYMKLVKSAEDSIKGDFEIKLLDEKRTPPFFKEMEKLSKIVKDEFEDTRFSSIKDPDQLIAFMQNKLLNYHAIKEKIVEDAEDRFLSK